MTASLRAILRYRYEGILTTHFQQDKNQFCSVLLSLNPYFIKGQICPRFFDFDKIGITVKLIPNGPQYIRNGPFRRQFWHETYSKWAFRGRLKHKTYSKWALQIIFTLKMGFKNEQVMIFNLLHSYCYN